jgi:prevent-host-death family protein
MDRFYARLAHYVRRAEAGGEVIVTRWGKPVARLVLADPDPVDGPPAFPHKIASS